MNKTKALIILGISALLTACGGGSKDDPSSGTGGSGGGGGTVTTPKATLSSWHVSNSAWFVRLDAGGANLNGTQFTFIGKFADNSEIDCATATMTGTEQSGTWYTTAINTHCPDDANTGHMAHGQGYIFETGGTGSYTNDGTVLQLCRIGSGCTSYY